MIGASAPTTGYSVAGVLQRYLPEFERFSGLPCRQQRILQKLITCRTPEAGCHAWQCQECGHLCANYNSCGDRHCLTCGVAQRMAWLEQMQSWTLPCHYWHIVFTLPHEFNELTAANPRLMYGLLFTAGTQALLRYLGQEFDVVPSMASVLHTWGQAMLPHFHSHNVASCGGLSRDGSRWIDIAPDDPRLAGDALPRLYRRLFLKRLRKLFEKQRLTLPAALAAIKTVADFDNWLSLIAQKPWMVNVQAPPAGCDGPATALGYLSRYMAGACIGDQRILNDDGSNVTIRIKDYRNDGALDEITMTGVEFMRRFVQHILPARFRRVRYAGLLGQRIRAGNLERCRELLKDRIAPAVEEQPETTIADQERQEEESAEKTPKCCPRCHAKNLLFIEHYWPEESGSDAGRWQSGPVHGARHPTQTPLQPVPP
jgi:hypothetical protein